MREPVNHQAWPTKAVRERSIEEINVKNILIFSGKVYDRIALQTRGEFESSVRKDDAHDPRLNISYWINYEGNLYQLGTTEEHSMSMLLPEG